MHCAACSGSFSDLVFMNTLLRVSLALKIVLIYRFRIRLNFSEIPFTCEIYREPRGFCSLFRGLLTLGINNRVNETLVITVELEITSQVADFFNHILSFLAYGGSSIVKTLDQTSLHMRRMAEVEVQVSASVATVVSSLMTRTSRKTIAFYDLFPW
jgi:hypothetical protein